jgi:hypothetical protein
MRGAPEGSSGQERGTLGGPRVAAGHASFLFSPSRLRNSLEKAKSQPPKSARA